MTSETAQTQIAFARFCIRQNVEPAECAELGRLANRAFKAGERHCNEGSDRTHKADLRAAAKFERFARTLGFGTAWYGLWPTLTKNGFDVELPGA